MAARYANWDTPPAPTVTLTPQARTILHHTGPRPASVRQITDRLDKPTMGAQRWTRSQVRHTLQALVDAGLVTRASGRLPWTVRYKRTPTSGGFTVPASMDAT